ncbi:MAG: diaminopimelate decarboxylase [Omnitrophica WOR_2 bacterium GWA2_47_8]|nr:MAG: diaminopimelate decarboxylase [Omnitrophica WOR_2 bacterium GWA2_47_8]
MSVTNQQLISLAKKYGTPLYAYDGDLVARRYRELFDIIKWPKLRIYYAMKANANVSILGLLEREGACLDTVSPAEVLLGLRLGFSPSRMLYTANNMTDEEIKEVHKTGVLMNFESLVHLDKFGRMFPKSEVCIRLNPDVVAGAYDKIKTGGALTKFGILLRDVPRALEIAKKHNLKIVGIHEHTGSGISNSGAVLKSMKNILQVATRESFPHLRFVDFGGGFGVPYRPEDKRIDYVSFGKKITGIFSGFCKKYGKALEMYFEPGRYIVAESGNFIVQVNNLKDNRGRLIAGVNSGFPQLIRPMFYGAYHHIRNLTHPDGKPLTYDVVGNICETGDRFAEQRKISEIRIGDYLVLETAGAYCYAMGGTYNLRPMPAEVIVEKGRDRLARKGLSNKGLVDHILEMSNAEE